LFAGPEVLILTPLIETGLHYTPFWRCKSRNNFVYSTTGRFLLLPEKLIGITFVIRVIIKYKK